MTVKLRSKPPYFCRSKILSTGRLCLVPLGEQDTSICLGCAHADALAYDRLMHAPIRPRPEHDCAPGNKPPPKRIWPE